MLHVTRSQLDLLLINDVGKKNGKVKKSIHSFVGLTDPDHVGETVVLEKAMERVKWCRKMDIEDLNNTYSIIYSSA